MVRVSADIRRGDSRDALWYEFPRDYLEYVTADRADAFLVALFLQCMHLGEPLHVEGVVSATLLQNLTNYAHAMRSLYPSLHQIDVTCDECDWFHDSVRGHEIGASFSGGTDALCTVFDNFVQADPTFRINRLVFVNVGTNGVGEFGAGVFRRRKQRLEAAAKEIGLPLLVVDSNLSDLCTYSVDDSTCARIVSCVLLFQKLFHTYLFPSTNTYTDICPEGSSPLSDHLLSTQNTRIVHDGAQHTRIEKTSRIAEWPVAQRYLNVCSQETPDMSNCSHCIKCIRAMLTADMLGLRSKFEQAFDFTDFAKMKAAYVREMLHKGTASPNFYWREILRHAEKSGYPLFPDDVRVLSPTLEPLVLPKANVSTSTSPHRSIAAFWRQDANLGDRLTPALLKHFGFEPQLTGAGEAEFVGAGSVLQVVPATYTGRIVGTGFQEEYQSQTFPKAEILAVRGRLTAERCRAPKDCLLADLGLLLPHLLPEPPPVRHTLAIVPHYVDQNSPQLRALAMRYPTEIVLVNVRADLTKSLNLIAASEYVLSSSLYGLIAADAFGKPNRWLVLSEWVPGGAFKFHDYYSAFDANCEPLFVDGSESLEVLLSAIGPPPSYVKERAEMLYERCKAL